VKLKPKFRIQRVAVGILMYLSAFCLLPLLYYKSLDGNEKYSLFQALYMKHLADSICHDSNTQYAQTKKLFTYVAFHCQKPQKNEDPVYTNAFQVDVHKSAYCDQQVLLLSKLLEALQIASETMYLYNPDSSISHTILQAYLANDTIAIDPFYQAFWAIDEKTSYSIQSLLTDSSLAKRINPDFNFYHTFIQKGSKIKQRRRENLLMRNSIITRWYLFSNLLSADILRQIICSERNKKLFDRDGLPQ
jgi:hypothetical protein